MGGGSCAHKCGPPSSVRTLWCPSPGRVARLTTLKLIFLREPLSCLRVALADVGTAVNTRSRGGMLPESPSTLGPKPVAAQPPPPSAGAGVGDVTGAGAGAGGGAGASSGATGTPPPQCGVCSKGFTSFRRRHYCKYVQRVSSTSAKQRVSPALCACIFGLECAIVISCMCGCVHVGRACGGGFCSDHSSRRLPLPHLPECPGLFLQRVCDK